jgi:hypothetical protein
VRPAGPVLTATALLLAVASSAAAYRNGAPIGHTGGFGEPHCGACHFDPARTAGQGEAGIDAPALYRPGEIYQIEAVLRDPDLAAAGFQLTARYTAGHDSGRQAGRLAPTDAGTHVAVGTDGVLYAGHTEAGAAADGGAVSWTLRWTAPDHAGPVIFHLAANAANDDESEFGDRIYLAERVVEPAP